MVRAAAKQDGPINLFDLVGFGDPVHVKLDELWQPRGIEDRYRIAIGLDDHGSPVHLDLKESGFGVGIFGSPGSGRSELLRTILFGLAATHSSAAVNFACISREHGDQVWRSLYQIPHTALAEPMRQNDLTGRRLDDALLGLLNWQCEQFNRVEVKNFADYQRIQPEAEFEPMPMLVVAIDDLPGVLQDRPDFAETISTLARFRHTGIKLVYTATSALQIPELADSTTTRIVLRTTEPDSIRLIGQPWAAHNLPNTAGSGYLATSRQEPPVRFRTAYTDLPHGTPRGGGYQTITQVFADRVRGQGPPARDLILPPPGERPTGLDALLPALEVTENRGFNAEPERRLSVPIGLLDNPYHHRHDPLRLDFSGPDGNLAIIGRPRSGKTTAVQTTLLALALTHTPAEVRFHCLDFGGSGLAPLRDLPHTRVVTGSHDSDHVALTVEELAALLVKREKSFVQDGIDSIAEFRKRRQAETLDEVATDHFLVVDGWPEVHQHPGLSDRVVRIAQRGLSYGIHVIVTANRWDDLPRTLRELSGGRIELRLAEPKDPLRSERAEEVPNDKPGRGVHGGRLCAIGTPALGDLVDDFPNPFEIDLTVLELGPKIRQVVDRINEYWPGDRLPQLRRPPAFVAYEDLPAAEPNAIPIGLDGHGEPVRLALDDERYRHLLITGGRESGKSTVIRTVLRGISQAYTKAEALVMVSDYRRDHHHSQVPEDQLLAYARSDEQSRSALTDIVAALRKRLPDPVGEAKPSSGPKLFIVVDDFEHFRDDLKMMCGLDELISHAEEIDLHLILAYNPKYLRDEKTIASRIDHSAIQLLLKDTPGPEWLVGGRGEKPLEAGDARMRSRLPSTNLRLAWLPEPQ